jgi:hypothetical protein
MALPRLFAGHLFGFCAASSLGLDRTDRFAGIARLFGWTLQRRSSRIPHRVHTAPPEFIIRRSHLNFVLPQLCDDGFGFSPSNFRPNLLANFEWILHEAEFQLSSTSLPVDERLMTGQ